MSILSFIEKILLKDDDFTSLVDDSLSILSTLNQMPNEQAFCERCNRLDLSLIPKINVTSKLLNLVAKMYVIVDLSPKSEVNKYANLLFYLRQLLIWKYIDEEHKNIEKSKKFELWRSKSLEIQLSSLLHLYRYNDLNRNHNPKCEKVFLATICKKLDRKLKINQPELKRFFITKANEIFNKTKYSLQEKLNKIYILLSKVEHLSNYIENNDADWIRILEKMPYGKKGMEIFNKQMVKYLKKFAEAGKYDINFMTYDDYSEFISFLFTQLPLSQGKFSKITNDELFNAYTKLCTFNSDEAILCRLYEFMLTQLSIRYTESLSNENLPRIHDAYDGEDKNKKETIIYDNYFCNIVYFQDLGNFIKKLLTNDKEDKLYYRCCILNTVKLWEKYHRQCKNFFKEIEEGLNELTANFSTLIEVQKLLLLLIDINNCEVYNIKEKQEKTSEYLNSIKSKMLQKNPKPNVDKIINDMRLELGSDICNKCLEFCNKTNNNDQKEIFSKLNDKIKEVKNEDISQSNTLIQASDYRIKKINDYVKSDRNQTTSNFLTKAFRAIKLLFRDIDLTFNFRLTKKQKRVEKNNRNFFRLFKKRADKAINTIFHPRVCHFKCVTSHSLLS